MISTDDAIRMAQEAGFNVGRDVGGAYVAPLYSDSLGTLERLVQAAYAAGQADAKAACDDLTRQLQVANADHVAAMRLVAEVRFACGDDGKRMLDELLQHLREQVENAARYRVLRDRIASKCDTLLVRIATKHENGWSWKSVTGDSMDSAIDAVRWGMAASKELAHAEPA